MVRQKAQTALGAADVVGNSAHERDRDVVLFCPVFVPASAAAAATGS